MACLVMYGLVAAKLLRKPATAAAKNKDNNGDNKVNFMNNCKKWTSHSRKKKLGGGGGKFGTSTHF